MKKKKLQKKHQAAPTKQQVEPVDTSEAVANTVKLMAGGIVIAAVVCVFLIIIVITQKRPTVILPASPQQLTTDGGPDAFGRPAGDEHYGHTHP